ncbi:hypothetical protein ACL04M_21065, partial [Streptomyces sp. TR06-5]
MRGEHLVVNSNGSITDNHPMRHDSVARHDAGYSDFEDARFKLMQKYERKIDRILKKATQADETAEAALKADPNGEEDDSFTTAGYTSLDDAVEAQRDAKRAAELMAGGASPTELSELNRLLSKHADEPLFAERFVKSKGADGTLRSYMTMMNPPPGTSEDQKAVLRKIQKNLGTTLGTASRIDSPAMDKFEKELMAAGD